MTVNLDPTGRRYTVAEYLAAEERAAYKSEFYHGEVFAMIGASEAHSTIVFNLSGALASQLRGKPCRGYSSDTKIEIAQGIAYFYPDLSVACGEPVFRDKARTILTNPRVIFEVLSPSTETFDREEKFAAYATLPSLTDYILISQRQPWIEHFAREGDRWLYRTATDPQGALEIDAIGCRLALPDVYDRLTFISVTHNRQAEPDHG
jgi:Uma2 family endonuclease